MKVTIRTLSTFFCLMALPLNLSLPAQQDPTIPDKEMRIAHTEDLRYPPAALSGSVQGLVVVRTKLDNNGKVLEAAALSGPELLIPETMTNVKKWRFEPNPHHAAIIVYNFRIADGICNASTSLFFVHPPNFVSVTACETPYNP
jgi:Gram-negative bacterial TonB protein C-terminal